MSATSGAGSAPAAGNADRGELARFDSSAARFWDPHGEFRPLHLLNPLRTQFVAERVALAGKRVLDVGCGGGLLAESLARAGAQVTAIDLAPGMIEVARLHAADSGLNIDYRLAAAEELARNRPQAFDVVTCMEMLEHVPQPAAMVATLAQLLVPGGALFASTLNRNLKSFLLAIVGAEYLLRLIPRGTHEYERLIRPAELARWARTAGLTLRELAGLELEPFSGRVRLDRRRVRELPGAPAAVSAPLIGVLAVAALLTGALLGALFTQLSAARRIAALSAELAAAQARLEASTLQDADRLSLLEQSETRLRAAFDTLAGETLRGNSELFLRLAREALGRDQAVAAGALKERELAIAQLVEPLRSALARTEAQVQALEHERREAFASLRTQIETLAGAQTQLQRETRNLVTALRRPEVRGRWGELTLRRLVELAGLSGHCDFTEQLQVVGEEGALRPDLVVHMPEARDLVIDAKTPLDAYLAALEAPSEEERSVALKRHAQQVETRVRELASKAYWTQFERSPEFAVLFLPGDQFLSAALAERPELLESALAQSVIIATPSTLIALLKAVAYGWRQSVVAQNAAQIRDLGQELYRRLSTFNGHLGRMGQRLAAAVEAYNAGVGSLERQVLPQARRFADLGVTADAPLAPPEPVGQLVRGSGAPGGADAAPEAAADPTSPGAPHVHQA